MKPTITIVVVLLSCIFANTRAGVLEEKTPHIFPFGIENELSKPLNSKPDHLGNGDAPKPCCFPETWEGVIRASIAQAPKWGPATHKSSQSKISIDGDNKRVAVQLYCPYLKDYVVSVVGLFDKSGVGFKLYVFKTKNPTMCWTQTWEKFVYKKTCIPDGATLDGSYKLGPANGGMAVNSFSYAFRSCQLDWSGNFVVTDACVPVIYREAGKMGGRGPKDKCITENDDDEDDDECAGDDDKDDNKAYSESETKEETVENQFRLLFKSKTPSDPFFKKPHPGPKPHPKPHPKCGSKKFVVDAYYLDVKGGIADPSVFNLPDICKKGAQSAGDAEGMSDRFKEGLETLGAVLEHIVV